MTQIDLWLAAIGAVTLLLGLSAGIIKTHGYLPAQPILAVAVGVLVGPLGLSVLELVPLADPLTVLEEVARLTVAFAVTSIALRLRPSFFRRQAGSLVVLLGAGMVTMWLASALVAGVVLPVGLTMALLLGAIVTPTDPVLANAIVVGGTATENIPERIRHLLSGEAGLNDGLAYPFVMLSLLLLSLPAGGALSEWTRYTLSWEVLGAVVLGGAIGVAVGAVERWESAQDYLEQTSVFTITVALTFFVVGATKLVGTNDILAVFVAGACYNWQADPADEAREQRVEEVFDRLFTIPAFVVFGMALPVSAWFELGWRAPALVVGVLLLRRLPMVLALRRFVDPLTDRRSTLFVGWFGPIGVAAVYYALLARRHTGSELPWVVGSLVVLGSVVAHGMTSTPATHWYGRSEGGDRGDGESQGDPAARADEDLDDLDAWDDAGDQGDVTGRP